MQVLRSKTVTNKIMKENYKVVHAYSGRGVQRCIKLYRNEGGIAKPVKRL